MTDPMGGSPLPPAVTQWTINGTGDRGAAPAPPFSTGTPAAASPAAVSLVQPAAPEPEPADDLMPWDAMGDEGEVAAVFEEDVALTTEEILATAYARREEFPVDAFIIPDDAKRVPTGMAQDKIDEMRHHQHEKPDTAHELADRFEKLSRRLRNEELDSLLPSLTRGDRFDALLAGFLAGYFSARDG